MLPARGLPERLRSVHLPAPVGGLNTIAAGSAMPATDCVRLVNMVAAELGLRSRLGSREWVTGLDGPVLALLPFTGSAANGAGNRLFATTATGIWDVSDTTAAPTKVLAFGSSAPPSGHGVAHAMVTGAGHFLLYTDEAHGYHVYSEDTDAWSKVAMGVGAGQVGGVDPANFAFVTVWKGRPWFVERDTASAWYLDAGAIYGAAATEFNFGRQFRSGGPLVGLWSWTIDGGAGLDDYLVAVSGGGDVAVYQGTDPDSATTFGLKGVWHAGGLPIGRTVATPFGGDLLLLTKAGVRPLSQLVSGGDGTGQYVTHKVANLFNQLMLTRDFTRGWAVHLHPEENALVVLVPSTEGAPEQLVMSLWNRSWSRYRDLPMQCAATMGGKLYFGTADGRVLVNDGYVDGVELGNPNTYTPVQWSLLTAFSSLGSARRKRVRLIKPRFLSESALPQFAAVARYDFDLAELGPVSGGAAGGSNAWDAALWDQATWAGDYQPSSPVRGGVGVGVDVALALRGQATSRTVLVGVDVHFEQGGIL